MIKKARIQLVIILILTASLTAGFILQNIYSQPYASVSGQPTNLFARLDGSNVTLTWDKAPGTTPKWYRVYRSTSQNGSYTRINHTNVTQTTFTDENITIPDSGYWYKVSPVFVVKNRRGKRSIEGPASTSVMVAGRVSVTPNPTTPMTYFVAPNGTDNGNPCTSSSSPCRQISYALTKAKPGQGDTISVASGTYNGFAIEAFGKDLPDATAVSKPLTIKGEGSVVINTEGKPGFIAFVEASKGIVLDGIKIEGTSRNNLRVLDSYGVTLKNSECAGGESACILMVRTNKILIDNIIARDSQEKHGIYISDKSTDVTIRRSYIYNNGGSGIQVNAEKLPGDSSRSLATNITIQDCVIYNNGGYGGAGINLMGVQDSVITNNLLLNNYATGIAAVKGSSGSIAPEAGPKNVTITNNTIVMAPQNTVDHRKTVRYAMQFIDSAGENTVESNVIYSPAGKVYDLYNTSSSDSGYLASDNNVYKNGSFVGLYDSGRAVLLSAWKNGAGWRGRYNTQNPLHDQNSDTDSVKVLTDLFEQNTPLLNLAPGSITRDTLLNYAVKPNLGWTEVGFDPVLAIRY